MPYKAVPLNNATTQELQLAAKIAGGQNVTWIASKLALCYPREHVREELIKFLTSKGYKSIQVDANERLTTLMGFFIPHAVAMPLKDDADMCNRVRSFLEHLGFENVSQSSKGLVFYTTTKRYGLRAAVTNQNRKVMMHRGGAQLKLDATADNLLDPALQAYFNEDVYEVFQSNRSVGFLTFREFEKSTRIEISHH
jgi:hypothetical protein